VWAQAELANSKTGGTYINNQNLKCEETESPEAQTGMEQFLVWLLTRPPVMLIRLGCR